MTDEEIKKKAKESFSQEYPENESINSFYIEGFLKGAKENGVVWHDLRKNPKDLPEDDKDVLVAFVNETAMGREILTGNDRYLADDKLWYYEGEGKNIVAWCEIPKFEEG